MNENGGVIVISLIIFVIMLFVYAAGGCSDQTGARDTLEKYGFTKIETYPGDIGAQYTCGDDYTYATRFAAINPNGMRVTGVVCRGIFKGSTVKF